MLRRIRRPAVALMLVAAALSLASCLSGVERDYVRYDAGKDEFQMLMVLTDLGAKETEDVDYLEGIYKNRDHLIAPVFPGGVNIFPLLGMNLLRMPENKVASINLFASRPGSLDTTETKVPLETITVTPGQFFVENGKLGYWQAYSVPGKTIDQALTEMSAAAQGEETAKGIQAELDRRAAGGKVFTWEELKVKALKEMTLENKEPTTEPADPTATSPAVEMSPEKVLEEQSLKNLLEAAKARTLGIKREKTALVLTLPLTAKDSAGAVDVARASLVRAAELAETPQTAENAERLMPFKIAKQIGGVAKLTAGDAGVVLSVDLLELTKATTALPANRIDMNDKKEEINKPIDLVEAIKAKGIAVAEGVTSESVVKAFNDGTLKGNPSKEPVKPGEGIVKPATP